LNGTISRGEYASNNALIGIILEDLGTDPHNCLDSGDSFDDGNIQVADVADICLWCK